MSQTIELTLTRRWELRIGSHHYIVDSDSELHDYLRAISARSEHIRCDRYYGPLPAGIYELAAVSGR